MNENLTSKLPFDDCRLFVDREYVEWFIGLIMHLTLGEFTVLLDQINLSYVAQKALKTVLKRFMHCGMIFLCQTIFCRYPVSRKIDDKI